VLGHPEAEPDGVHLVGTAHDRRQRQHFPSP